VPSARRGLPGPVAGDAGGGERRERELVQLGIGEEDAAGVAAALQALQVAVAAGGALRRAGVARQRAVTLAHESRAAGLSGQRVQAGRGRARRGVQRNDVLYLVPLMLMLLLLLLLLPPPLPPPPPHWCFHARVFLLKSVLRELVC